MKEKNIKLSLYIITILLLCVTLTLKDTDLVFFISMILTSLPIHINFILYGSNK